MDEELLKLAARLAGRRLGARAWELLSAGWDGRVRQIPSVSPSIDSARLRAVRQLCDLGLVMPSHDGDIRKVRLTTLGLLVTQEVAQRHLAGVKVRWPSVIASIQARLED